MDYPKHLSEKIREEVAVSYLKHELRKIFPSIKTEEVDNLMSSKELCNPRDFWNGLHGISMGFKLKNILYLVTAENISWTKEKINCRDLNFGVEMSCTKVIREGKVSGKEFADFYKKNPEEKAKQLAETIRIRGNDMVREEEPIMAIEKEKALSVHDGNGRLARFLLEDKETIEVYLGKMTGKTPTNFWLPTSLLMDNLFFVYQAIENKNEELFVQQIAAIKNMLSFSESGRVEFTERALTSKAEYRGKILAALGF
jgi:hypothetical protein